MEFGHFIYRTGFAGKEENVVKLFESFDPIHRLMCIKQWHLQNVEAAAKNPVFKTLIKEIMKIAV